MISSFSFVVSFVFIIMTRSANQTTIAVSREHYNALIKLGGKNETFDQIVGKLLKNASMSQNEDHRPGSRKPKEESDPDPLRGSHDF